MYRRRVIASLFHSGQRRWSSVLGHRRDERFARVEAEDIGFFKSLLGEEAVVTDPFDLQTFNRDWMGKYEGASKIAVKPRTTEQMSAILQRCYERCIAVVPQGGNTGLVGGSVPVFDEIIISTSNMNRILGFDKTTGVLTCQSGCILESLDDHVNQYGHIVPLDLGAKGSCHIGGNVATNAGGLRLLRYGSLHGSVLGLEVVLANGTILDLLATLRKDNSGYDLKHLFIGSEGTLGIITAVSLLCPPKPTSMKVAYLACPTFDSAIQTLNLGRTKLGEILSAFEFLDSECLELALQHLPGVRDPLAGSETTSKPFFIVLETSGSNETHDTSKLEDFLNCAISRGIVTDGVVAQDNSQANAIWSLREGIPTALRHRGAVYKYDISLPIHEMYDLVEATRVRILEAFPDGYLSSTSGDKASEIGESNALRNIGSTDTVGKSSDNVLDDKQFSIKVLGYGHLGDGNVHLNVSVPRFDEKLEKVLEPWVYEWTSSRRGSISAEHGIGIMKASNLKYSKSESSIKIMKSIKNVLDPSGILNPYKTIPSE